MASFIRLEDNWVLSDGITVDVQLTRPETVDNALLDTGIVKNAYTDRTACEWAFRREWTYSVRFDAPVNDERLLLRTQGIHGKAAAYINGRFVGNVSASCPDTELSEGLKPDENEIRLVFDAPSEPDYTRPLPKIGLETAPRLVPLNYISYPELLIDADTLEARISAEYHVGGRYTAVVSSYAGDDESTDEISYTVNVGRHETALIKLRENSTDVRVTVKRGAEICAVLDEKIPASAVGAYKCIFVNTLNAAAMYRDSGTNAIRAPEWIEKRRPELARAGKCDTYEPLNAMDVLQADEAWPPRDTAWKMLAPESNKLENHPDRKTAVRRSRYRQAAELRNACENARVNKKPICIECAEPDMNPFSRSLFDGSGDPRPAFYALKQAWSGTHICMLPPDTAAADAHMEIPVYLVSDEEKFEIYSTDVYAYLDDGTLIGGASYPVRHGECVRICDLMLQTPSEAKVIAIRAVLKLNGDEIDRWDGMISMDGADMPEAKLRIVNGTMENISKCVCFGITSDRFANLLPGETYTPARDIHGCEGLNIDNYEIN